MSVGPSGRVSGRTLERLRAQDAREAAKLQRAEERRLKRERQHGTRERFESLIDTSAGPAGCHLWCGETKSNHPTQPHIKQYDEGTFELEGVSCTRAAHRLQVLLAFGLPDLPSTIDIAPTCGNHLCVNLAHLVVRPHATADRVQQSVPVVDYFRAEAAKALGHSALEAAADALLAEAA
jgi:hypothetical protein